MGPPGGREVRPPASAGAPFDVAVQNPGIVLDPQEERHMFGSKVAVDSELLKRCKAHASEAGYSSVEEFVQHALERALKEATGGEDDERVLDRLKGLGYIE
jgi:hypothetical protein